MQVGREQRGLIATGAGADFNDRRTVIQRVVRDEERFGLLLELDDRAR